MIAFSVDKVLRYTVEPGGFYDAAVWVLDMYREREMNRVTPGVWSVGKFDEDAPIAPELPLPRLSQFRMGRFAFMEAQATHKACGLWAVDYCDGKGPRVRIGPLVANEDVGIPEWDIELE